MEEKIRQKLKTAVSEKVFSGCVVGVVDVQGKKTVIPVGTHTYEGTSPAVYEDTIYDVASVTKVIPVSCLALQLIDEGKISLNDKIVDFLPELQQMRFCSDVLIRHYLTMTLDYHYPLSSLKEKTPGEILQFIYSTQFRYKPGKKLNYSNAASIVLGILIERVTGKPLDRAADERFFHPLGMTRTSFHPERFPKEQLVPTESDPWRGRIIRGEIHDESAYILREKMIPGSAGLFSTVPDLLTFLQMLLHKGIYKKRRYFSGSMIEQMAANQLDSVGEYGGLGWELYQPRYMGRHCSKRTIGKTGFTGCVVICDILQGKGVVMLSNYHFPTRKSTTRALDEVRRDIADAVFI